MKINTDKTSGVTITKNVVKECQRYMTKYRQYKDDFQAADSNLKEMQATIDSLQETIVSLQQEKSYLECQFETERAIKADLQAKQSDVEASAENRVKESKATFLNQFEEAKRNLKQKLERELQEDYSKKLTDASGEVEQGLRQKFNVNLEKEIKLLQQEFEKVVTPFKIEIKRQNHTIKEYEELLGEKDERLTGKDEQLEEQREIIEQLLTEKNVQQNSAGEKRPRIETNFEVSTKLFLFFLVIRSLI